MTDITFQLELLASVEGVRRRIHECEGKHVQQAMYSTYMDTLTQICFTCRKVRSNVMWEGNRSWTPS
jgi:hypothetical protein